MVIINKVCGLILVLYIEFLFRVFRKRSIVVVG